MWEKAAFTQGLLLCKLILGDQEAIFYADVFPLPSIGSLSHTISQSFSFFFSSYIFSINSFLYYSNDIKNSWEAKMYSYKTHCICDKFYDDGIQLEFCQTIAEELSLQLALLMFQKLQGHLYERKRKLYALGFVLLQKFHKWENLLELSTLLSFCFLEHWAAACPEHSVVEPLLCRLSVFQSHYLSYLTVKCMVINIFVEPQHQNPGD